MMKEEKVFHVVLTGGEPFMNFDVLVYALEKFSAAGISTSINSNLMLATPEKVLKLRNTGLDHVLTIKPTRKGEFPIICNEFCGIGHHLMTGKIIVE